MGVTLMNVVEGECLQSGPLSRLGSYLGMLAVLCLFWALGGCGRDEGLPMPVGINAAELPEPASDGAQLTARYCSQCHGIPSPTSHSRADWEPTVRRMVRYMEISARMRGMMGGGMMRQRSMPMHGAAVPPFQEQRTILAYLQTHALQSISEQRLPESVTPEAVLFTRTCSRCHALPDPAQHTPAQWPAVVERMRQHLNEQKGAIPSNDALQQIVGYLQRVSGKQGS